MAEPTRIYLDYASEAPMVEAARTAVLEWLDRYGDPSRIYSEALAARASVEAAREEVASFFGARQRDVTFTSSGTEALNQGVTAAARINGSIAVGAVEHSAVIDAARRLEADESLRVEKIGVRPDGTIDLASLAEVLASQPESPAVAFIQHSNHELGTIQPVDEAAEICHAAGASIIVDACQSAGRIPVTLEATGADALIVSAHKFGGPPGIGALITRRGFRLGPLIVGGTQERGRRAGPENVGAISGFGAAVASIRGDLAGEAARERELTKKMRDEITAQLEGVRLLGAEDDADRLPHIVAMELPGVQGEPVLLSLDQAGYSVHSGSACSNEILEPSHILEAVGGDSRRNLRVSVGRETTADQIDQFVPALATAVERLAELAKGSGE